ncbi:MAG: hypothetical protein R3E03_00070 [Novosphingobium sp.]
MSLSEAAIVAGLVKAPSHYAPTADKEAAVGRAGVVLSLMESQGVVSSADAAAVDFSKVKFAAESGQNSVRYFTDWALPQLDLRWLGETSEPIEVRDHAYVGMQRAATEAIRQPGSRRGAGRPGQHGPRRAVLALVGGTDYVSSNYNRAVNSCASRPAWKLFVYLAALEAGYTPNDKVADGR